MKTRLSSEYVRVVFLILLLVAAGCSDNEINSPLVGEWEGIRFMASEPVDENGDSTAHTDLKEEMDCVSMQATFRSNGNFILTSYEATYDIDIVNGEVILTPTGCSPIEETGRWYLNESSSILSLEFNVPGKDAPTRVEVNIQLSAERLILINLPFSDDGSITYSVEFQRK